ncbi:MAG: PGN_0703 family putative restriction endonuclease [Candidatus Acidiferrales bacterium]
MDFDKLAAGKMCNDHRLERRQIGIADDVDDRMGIKMNISTNASFWLDDIEGTRPASNCPIKGCGSEFIRPNMRGFPCCEKHGLEIHAKTFVYFNGESRDEQSQARLRNFLPGGARFLSKHIFGNKNKAESHRLGAENSEDALSWNVFGELHRLGLVHLAYNYLTGDTVEAGQVRLFLWGLEIDFDSDTAREWPSLKEVRDELEKGINSFRTEPDIMLLGPRKLVIVEAKLTSGNPLCVEASDVEGMKPTSRSGLIHRYIAENKLWEPVLCDKDIGGSKIHSQLLRMIVFASTMAQKNKIDWAVVNLVSRTQWKKVGTRPRKGYDFENPREFIPTKVGSRFRFLSWEELFNEMLSRESGAQEIAEYMQKKTVNLSRAFEFSEDSLLIAG